MNRFLNKVVAWLKLVVKMLVGAGIIFLVFRYAGGFSEQQSVFLALAFWVIYSVVTESRREDEFEPYFVSIEPKWYELLRDYKLVKDEDWKAFSDKMNALSESEYHVLRQGFRFTVLKPLPSNSLIYRDDRKHFHGNLDFRERIEEIELLLPETKVPFSPSIFVKWGSEGYDIGITTPESFKKSYHPLDNLELVTVATLPYEIFRSYMTRSIDYGLLRINEKAQKTAVKKHGWKTEQHDADLSDRPETFEHKYFWVFVNGI